MGRTTNYITRTFTTKTMTLSIPGKPDFICDCDSPSLAIAMYANVHGVTQDKVTTSILETEELYRMPVEKFKELAELVPATKPEGKDIPKARGGKK